jgi:hypothetical protein
MTQPLLSEIIEYERYVQRKARELCQAAVGDPNALDRNGNPRWEWYVERARAEIAEPMGGAS